MEDFIKKEFEKYREEFRKTLVLELLLEAKEEGEKISSSFVRLLLNHVNFTIDEHKAIYKEFGVEYEEIIPLGEGQKIDYRTIQGFPERTEINSGELLWSQEEKKSVILGVLANTGLEFLVSILPERSFLELKKIVCR